MLIRFLNISQLYLICFLFGLLPTIVLAQSNGKKDSLLMMLDSRHHDTTEVFILTQLSKEYQSESLDSAYYYINEALLLSKELNYNHGLAESYACLGDIEVTRDNLDKAKDSYLKSISYFEILNKNSDLIQVYLVLGNIFLTQDNYFNALNYYHEAVKIAEEIEFLSALAYLYTNLGLVYYKIEKLDKALEFLLKAREITNESGNIENQASILINIGTIYFAEGDHQLAKSYYEKANAIAIKTNDKALESDVLVSIGEIYEKEEQYDQALSYYKKSTAAAQLIDDKFLGPKSIGFVRSYFRIGSIYFIQKKFQKAITYLEKSHELAEESGQLGTVSNNAELLSLAYEALDQNIKSLYYARIFKTASDSIFNKDIIKKIAQIELRYEFDQQLQVKELEQTRKDAIQKRKELIYFVVAAGSFLSLLLFVLLYSLLKNKVKRVKLSEKNLKLEKDTLKKELEYKNKELTTNVMYLLKKNEFILKIVEKLKVARIRFKVENRKIADDIIRELESSSSNDTWKEFELRFQEVHTNFYNKLNDIYPDLSPNEQKLCAFLRLNMSTKEIATITYISVNSINIARHRLRKKLNIEHEENLISFLTKL